MDSWRRSFLNRLHEARSRFAEQFEEALDQAIVPVFDDLASFLCDNGFTALTPLKEQGRRSFKFELAENAYLLIIFRFSRVGEFELHAEMFAPGSEPLLEKSGGRITDIDRNWAQDHFRAGLDRFVNLLAGKTVAEPDAELARV